MQFAVDTRSWHPVMRNGWVIKFSAHKDSNILLFVISKYTGQTIVRYFSNEDEACTFINFIQNLDSQETYDL